MEAAVICKVAVSAAPYAIDKPYDYLVPEAMLETAVPGVRVMVPFGRGNRSSEGVVLARGTGERTPKLKPLKAVLDQSPVLDRAGIELALWMSAVFLYPVRGGEDHSARRTVVSASGDLEADGHTDGPPDG